MNTTRYIIKIAVKIIMFIVISTIAMPFLNGPIISNELAMTQMENSNELYLVVEVYNNMRHIISVVYGCIATALAGTTIYDIYKLTKENKGEE